MRAWTILTLAIRVEADVVLARQRARQIADLLGFDTLQQTRIATAVSEIARNAFRHAGGGWIEYQIDPAAAPPSFVVRVMDPGPGIPESSRSMQGKGELGSQGGTGLVVARRLVDHFEIETSPVGGTTVRLEKRFPRNRRFSAQDLARVVDELTRRPPESLLEELHQQNQEILRVLEDLMRRQEELKRLNHELEETNRGVMALYGEVTQELEDTNRGVLALYAELDNQAEQLRRANYLQSQFFAYMSHEFRTPLNSSIALSGLLLDRADGPLTAEQEKQLRMMRKSSEDLLDLVDDLLDNAKLEAGKLEIRLEAFSVADLFSALRGMLRPLSSSDAVNLVFEELPDLPPLYTDQSRLSQILRNLISNALKFTTRGEVRVSAKLQEGEGTIVFSVADTGIGIAPENQEKIFQDFAQVEGPTQHRVKGTGLGLPLSRKLAQMFGGSLSVESTPGAGSTFSVVVPLVYVDTEAERDEHEEAQMERGLPARL